MAKMALTLTYTKKHRGWGTKLNMGEHGDDLMPVVDRTCQGTPSISVGCGLSIDSIVVLSMSVTVWDILFVILLAIRYTLAELHLRVYTSLRCLSQ
jgi:hypothetical protein